MSRFIPSKGDFFYVQIKPWDHVVGGFLSDTVEVVKQHDRSYRGDVFTCAGRDDHAVVGTRESGFCREVTFVHDEVDYFPVGPEVLQALGLSKSESEPA